MSLFVIGDLHLALGDKSKSMDIFDGWENYTELLGQSWNSLVSAEDTIVLAGDISWAISLEKGYEDFKWIHNLPGRKIILNWLAYDFPRERVEAAAAEMTYAYRKTKGERVVTDGGIETVKELYRRGYTLGIVSDLVGTEEVDEWLDHDQLRPYFKTVQQSSVCLIRKPHPAIYYYALEECGSDPKRTCYVGDNLARDIVGAKAAGLGMTIGVRYPGKKPQEITEENKPDRFISHFAQLLDIFPAIK